MLSLVLGLGSSLELEWYLMPDKAKRCFPPPAGVEWRTSARCLKGLDNFVLFLRLGQPHFQLLEGVTNVSAQCSGYWSGVGVGRLLG